MCPAAPRRMRRRGGRNTAASVGSETRCSALGPFVICIRPSRIGPNSTGSRSISLKKVPLAGTLLHGYCLNRSPTPRPYARARCKLPPGEAQRGARTRLNQAIARRFVHDLVEQWSRLARVVILGVQGCRQRAPSRRLLPTRRARRRRTRLRQERPRRSSGH
jgi:hypothetical protein